jgi:hypothetical protein
VFARSFVVVVVVTAVVPGSRHSVHVCRVVGGGDVGALPGPCWSQTDVSYFHPVTGDIVATIVDCASSHKLSCRFNQTFSPPVL